MIIISLGWGVQSFALAAMSALGTLPRVDAAVHADTTHERAETYEFAKKWTPWLEERGISVVTVTGGRALVSHGGGLVPAFTTRANGKSSGLLRRQCTSDWKIGPIRRWLQAKRDGQQVEQWLGITLDEVGRAKASNVQYIHNAFPFLEMLDRTWRRGDVIRWLLDNGLEVPVKSSCVICPYHDNGTWREINIADNGDWEEAIRIDGIIRHHCGPDYVCYLHQSRQPLATIDFRSQEDWGQQKLWETEECGGNCFL